MRGKLFIGLYLFGLIVGLSSCFKNENFPDEPRIYDPDFVLYPDSAQLVFHFEDGDGDIGLSDSELDPPYDTTSKYYYNLYIEYYEKDDNLGWVPGLNLDGDSVIFKYRLEPIEIKGKSRGIRGTMEVAMETFYNPLSSESDTIMYRIQLIDRALHESNVLQTDPIVHGL